MVSPAHLVKAVYILLTTLAVTVCTSDSSSQITLVCSSHICLYLEKCFFQDQLSCQQEHLPYYNYGMQCHKIEEQTRYGPSLPVQLLVQSDDVRRVQPVRLSLCPHFVSIIHRRMHYPIYLVSVEGLPVKRDLELCQHAIKHISTQDITGWSSKFFVCLRQSFVVAMFVDNVGCSTVAQPGPQGSDGQVVFTTHVPYNEPSPQL